MWECSVLDCFHYNVPLNITPSPLPPLGLDASPPPPPPHTPQSYPSLTPLMPFYQLKSLQFVFIMYFNRSKIVDFSKRRHFTFIMFLRFLVRAGLV